MGRLVPKRKTKAYILSETVAFVEHPEFRAMWMKVHPSVILCDCRNCGSKKGVPCFSRLQYVVGAHRVRKDDGGKVKLDNMIDHTIVRYSKPPSV